MSNIMKVKEFDEAIFYKTSCDCLGGDHVHTLILEYDNKHKNISLSLCGNIGCYEKNYDSWFIKIWERIKLCKKLLFTGNFELEDVFDFNGEDHIKDYIKALEKGIKKLKKDNKNGKNTIKG